MSFSIAIAGKGGTGKTTLAGLVILSLTARKNKSILAVDADPNSNLSEMLGIKSLGSIVEIIDSVAKSPGEIPAGVPKERYIELQVQEAVYEGKEFDLLVMGRPEGPGCYCYANSILRNMVEKLLGAYDYVVIDNEAGMEHLSRRTMRRADLLLLVTEPNPASIRSAGRIIQLIKELDLDFKKKVLVVNKVDKDKLDGFGKILDAKLVEPLGLLAKAPSRAENNVHLSLGLKPGDFCEGVKSFNALGADSIVAIPYDEEILDLGMEARPLSELQNKARFKEIFDALIP